MRRSSRKFTTAVAFATWPRRIIRARDRARHLAAWVGWVALLFAVRADAAGVFYVDRANSSCSNSGAGTSSQPYCSISAAVSARGGPGTTILVKPGTYREQVTVSSSGTAAQPFIIRADGAGVVVDGADDYGSTSQWTLQTGNVWLASGVSSSPDQVFVNGQRLIKDSAVAPELLPAGSFRYVSGSGLYVNVGGSNPGSQGALVGARRYGFRVDQRAHVVIDGFTIRRFEDRGVYITGQSRSVTIEKNQTSWCGKNGVGAVSCSSLVIRNNVFSDHSDHGAYAVDVHNSTYEGNEAMRNARPSDRAANGLYFHSSTRNVVRANRLHRNQDTGLNFTTGSNNNLCYNNLFYLNGDHGADHTGSSNIVHLHSVSYRNFKDGFSFEGGSPGGQVFNCIGIENGLTTGEYNLWVDASSSVGFTSNYNIWWNSTTQNPIKFGSTQYSQVSAFAAATGNDVNTLQVNPMFVDTSAAIFRPDDRSPAIDNAHSGVADWPATDFFGRARIDDPVTPNTGTGPVPFADRGAIEFLPNVPPTAVVTVDPESGIGPLPVMASGAGSSDSDGTIISYTFNFGDGTVVGPQSSPTANHTYAIGEWPLLLTIVDNRGGSDTASVPVVVSPNRIGNGSFESSTAGWAATGPATIARVSGGLDGSFSCQITGSAVVQTFGLNDSPNWIDNLPAVNSRYRFTAWVRSLTHSGKVNLRVREYLSGVLQSTSTSSEVPVTSTWKLISVDHLSSAIGSTLDYNVIYTPNGPNEVFQVDHLTARVVTLDRPPVVNAPATVSGDENTIIMVPVTAMDPDGEAMGLTANLSALPAGNNAVFTTNPSHTSGTLTWTPKYQDARAQAYNITFTASNVLSGSATTAITVNDVDPAPVVTAPDSASGVENRPLSVTVFAADPDSTPITVLTADLSRLPAGHNAVFTPGAGNRSGVLTWTPTFRDSGGPYRVIFTATNTRSASDTTDLYVDNTDEPPMLTVPATISVGEGQPLSFQVTAVDFDGQSITSLTADLSRLPAGHGATFTAVADRSSGEFRWTPALGTPAGPYPVMFRAANALVDTDTTLVRVDQAPVVTAPATARTGENQPLTVNVTAADPDSDPITTLMADLSGLPAGHDARFTAGAGNTSGTLTWTPTSADGRAAPYAVKFTASNVLSASATTSITVDQPPVVTAPSAVTVAEGEPLTVSVTASDPDGEAIASLTADLSTLPAGHDAVFTTGGDQTSGTLTWTPTFNDGGAGPYDITFTATNLLSGSTTTSVTVDQHPVVTAPAIATGNENAVFTVAVTASDADGDAIESLTADLAGLPPGNDAIFTPSADRSAGTLRWTPTFNDSGGPYRVTFAAANALSGEAATSLWVANVDRAPVPVAPATAIAGEGELFTLPVTAADPDGDAISSLSANLSGLPAGHNASFTSSAGGTSGTLTWTPTFNDGGAGPYVVSFTAANALSATTSTSVTVDQHPVVTAPETASGTEDVEMSFTVSASDPDGEPITALTADVSGLPAGHTAVFTPQASQASGIFTWRPDYFAAPGPHTVRFIASNLRSGRDSTNITVENVDRAPMLNAPAAISGGEGTEIEVGVTAIDPDLEPITTLSADLSGLPSGHNGAFATSPDLSSGAVTWTPRFGDGASGPYIVTFLARNQRSALSATAIIVDRHPIVTAPDTVEVFEEAELTVSVTADDPDMEPIVSFTADVSGLPVGHNAGFTANADRTAGTLTWRPTFEDQGLHEVVFRAVNALVGTRTTVIRVLEVDRAPTVVVPNSTVAAENTAITIQVTASDPEGQPITSLTADLSVLPAGHNATFTTNASNTAGTFVWTPRASDAPGPYTVTFTASNALAGSSSVSIAVDRMPVISAPVSVAVDEDSLLTLMITVSDPDGDEIQALSADLSGLPNGNDGIFTSAADRTSGVLTWTPGFDDGERRYTVTFAASNALTGGAATEITVINTDRAPVVAAPDSVTVPEGNALTVNVAASDPDGDTITSLAAALSILPVGHNAVFTASASHTSGTLTWTPTLDDGRVAPYDMVFTATNARVGSTVTRIKVDQRPEIAVASSVTGFEGQLMTLPLTAVDPDGQPILSLTANLSGLPSGHNAVFTPSADRSSATLTWTPTYDDSRGTPYIVTFVAANNLSGGASTAIRVNNTDRVPVVSAPAALSVPGDSAITIQVTASDPDGEAISSLTADLSPLPTGHNAAFTPNGTRTAGIFTWTPRSSDPAGPYAVVFRATNAASGSTTTSITVDQFPVVTAPANVSGSEGSPVSVNVVVVDPNGDPITSLTANLSRLPTGHGATFTPNADRTSGILTWTPGFDHAGGPYPVTFTASNSLSSSATTEITIGNTDRAPVVSAPASATGPENQPITVAVTAADADGDPIATFSADLSRLPAGHNAAFSTNAARTSGTFQWTPTFNDSGGPYDVTFTVSNALSGSTTTAIRVTNTDRAPIVNAPTTATGNENTVITVSVSASDPDGDPITSLTADLGVLPAGNNATFSVSADRTSGTLSWTPTFDDGRPGPYNLNFTAANARAGFGTTAILVTDSNRSPVVTAPATASGPENSPLIVNVTASDADGDPINSLSADLSGLPVGHNAVFTASANRTSGTLNWTPTFADAPGPYSVTFTAANLLAGVATTSITVTNLDRAPVVTAPATVSGTDNRLITVNLTAADPDGEAISSLVANLSTLPAGHTASFVPSADRGSGTFTWTPRTSDVGGPYPVTFTAANALAGSTSTGVTVIPSNVAPTAALVLTPASGPAPLSVTADASGSSDSDGTVVSYEFDFGDGTVVGPQASPTASHTLAFGLWIVRAIAIDNQGGRDTAIAAVNARAVNLALNPSFETGLDGWNANGSATLTRVPGGQHGSFSVELRGGSSTSKFGLNDSPNWVDFARTGERYRFTAWVRSASSTGHAFIRIREYNGGSNRGESDSPPVTLSPAWQMLMVDRVASSEGSTLDMLVLVDPRVVSESFQVDNVSIYRVVPDSPPVVSAPPSVTAPENTLITVSVTAADPDGDPILALAADLSALPLGHNGWFTEGANHASGTLTWTPTFNDSGGPYNVSFTATNVLSGAATTAIRVTNGDRPPVVTAPSAASGAENSVILVNVSASDPDGEPIVTLSADLSALPAGHGAVFTPSADRRSGTLAWTPGFAAAPGPYSVTFTAANALSGFATTKISVTDVNGPPVVSAPDTVSGPENRLLTVAVTASDPDGEAITSLAADLNRLPIGHNAVFTSNASQTAGTLNWTPTYGDSGGPYRVTFTATNAQAGSTTTAIRVVNSDRAPVVSAPPTATVAEKAPLALVVTAADADGDAIASLSANLAALPAGHNALFSPGAGNSSGTFTWTPTFADAPGPYSVTFTAANALSGSGVTAISVTQVDAPPVVSAPDTARGGELNRLIVNISASDPDGESISSLTADLSALPGGHNAVFSESTDNTSGMLTWTPVVGDSGRILSVSFTASNAMNGAATTVLVIGGRDRAPVVVAPAQRTVVENSPLTVNVTASDPDGETINSLTADLSGLPAGHNAVFTANASRTAGTLTWTPTYADAPGPYVVTFAAANVLTGTAATEILLTNLDRAPVVIAPATASGVENTVITVNVTASDPDAEPIVSLAAHLAALPAGHGAVFTPSADRTSGTLSWTPGGGHVGGPYSVTFTAANALAGSTTTALTVVSANQRPTAFVAVTPSSGAAPLNVTLDASGSRDSDGSIVSYLFQLGDGTVKGPQAGPTTTHTYSQGVWSARVIVTDNAGARDSMSVVVDARALNLVLNPSFESSLEGWNGNGSASLSRVGGGQHGSFAVEIRGGSSTSKFGINDSPNWVDFVRAGERYRFTAWARSTASTGRVFIRVREYLNGSNQGETDSPGVTLSPTWQKLTVDRVAVRDNSTLDLLILDEPRTGSEVFQLDNVSAYKVVADSPPAVAAPTTVTAPENTPITVNVTATDPDGEAINSLTANLSSLPSGHNAVFTASADRRSGVFTWTPSFVDAGGPYVVSFTATNLLSGTASTAIFVQNVDRVPVVTAPPTASGPENTVITINVTASDPDGQAINSLAANLIALPGGHNALFAPGANNASGTLTWRPTFADAPGPYAVVFTATNTASGSATTSISVTDVNGPPAVMAPDTARASAGNPLTVNVTASDPDGEAIISLTADLSALPSGHNAVFTPSGDRRSGILAWTPVAADSGRVVSVNFTAANGQSGSKRTTILVGGSDRAPVVTAPATRTILENSQLTVSVTASDPDGEAITSLTADLSGLPSGHNGVFTPAAGNAAGTFTWTPTLADAPGPYNVIFSARNARTGTATTVITVTNLDRAPIVSAPPTASGQIGSQITVNVTASDPDGEAISSLTANLSVLPAGHNAVFTPGPGNTSGTFTWTPSASAESGGPYNVTFTASNALSGSATTAISAGVNLVRNPSFETNLDGWKENGPGTISRVAGGFDGGFAVEIRGTSSSGKFGVTDSPDWVTGARAGERYRFSAWVRSSVHRGTAMIRIREYVGSSRVRTTDSPGLRLTTTWQKITVDHVVARDNSELDLLVLDDPLVSGEIFQVDLISIQKVAGGGTAVQSEPVPVVAVELEVPRFVARFGPNPVSGEGTLVFTTTRPGFLSVRLFDAQGREVRTLMDEADAEPKRYVLRVDGRDEFGSLLASGVYFYRIDAREGSLRGRFAVVR